VTDVVRAFRDRFFGPGGVGQTESTKTALAFARGILSRRIGAGKAPFKSPAEIDAALREDGLRLVANDPFGPPVPDARQLIYASADRRVLVKVKTRGYADGRRAGGTMSIELGTGQGTSWKDIVCKLDRNGEPIPSNVVMPNLLVRTPDGVRVKRASGQVEPLMPHEVVLDDAAGFDPNAFADRGHFDFPPGFDPAGVEALRP
jgi:hypothetical protein